LNTRKCWRRAVPRQPPSNAPPARSRSGRTRSRNTARWSARWPKGAANYYEATYQIAYADPKLVSLVFTFDTFTGGAHPNHARTALLFDLAAGRALKLADVLTDPKEAAPEIAMRCKAQLEEQAKKEDWELFDNADVAAVVGDAANWAADKDGIEILFDPYSVAAYVVGPRECRLSYSELAKWLKPGGPLPPQS
jgi:hypothetical protein